MVEIGGCPPIAQTAVSIEGAAFGVKGMADFVTDDRADRAIVRGVWCIGVEKWRLDNCGREIQRILKWQVHGIDSLRGHCPLVSINGLAQARDLTVIFEQAAAPCVSEDIVWFDFE